MSDSTSGAGGTPAGWYLDPRDGSLYRYWDGQQWTDQTAPAQASAAAPVEDEVDPSEAERGDVRAALQAMKSKSGVKRELRSLGAFLQADEHVIRLAVGTRGSQRGVLGLTDHRLFFYWQGMVRQASETIPLDLITGVALSRGMISSSIKTQGAQALEEVGQIDKADAQSLADALREIISRRGADVTAPRASFASTAPQPSSAVDPLETLRQLKQLLDQGLITAGDYEAKKVEVLHRM